MTHFDLYPHNSALLVIDVQEAFSKAIPDIDAKERCGHNAALLIQAAELLQVPVLFTEQYPKGLGHTLPHLRKLASGAAAMHKTAFSCADDTAIRSHLAEQQRDNVIICGIEAHVCVLATAADLLRRAYNVCIAADAIASRNPEHCRLAADAARDLGALLLPVESIVMRLQRDAAHDSFKALSRMIR